MVTEWDGEDGNRECGMLTACDAAESGSGWQVAFLQSTIASRGVTGPGKSC
jgi:hypothetical protein